MASATSIRVSLGTGITRLGAPLAGLRRGLIFPLGIILFFLLVAVFAPLVTPYSPTKTSLPEKNIPPFWQEGGSISHPLGTDPLGRDIWARLAYGARVSLLVAFSTLALGGVMGTALGLISGYYRGLDPIVMRASDITIAFPIILFAILLVVIIGAGLINLIIAVGLVIWARYARVIRGEVLTIMTQDYIARAKVAGASDFRIITRHIFPNVVNTLVVLLTLQVGFLIIVESSLSFLGAGVPPPTAAWGSMVASGRDYIVSAWWVSAIPGVAIMLLVIAFNMLGDWLRDRLDPKLRQV
jgi:peptide/nickel transport system permease protein